MAPWVASMIHVSGLGNPGGLTEFKSLTGMLTDIRVAEHICAWLQKINYSGWTEIFMHPVPRGIPILETAAKVTVEIN